MKYYWLKIFIVHILIATVYFGVTGYMFIHSKAPNPIGIGLQQWVCMILHLIITTVVMLLLSSKAIDKKIARTKIIANLIVVLLIIIVSAVLSNTFWHWLWELRENY
jgi:hypothetical protein